jgi:GntR family transcriptional regulator
MAASSSRRVRLRVDPRSKTPAYRQIVEQVRAAVAAGTLAPGDQLPTARSLASQTHIHFNTVARAYRLLDRAGMLSAQRGRGTYVLARKPAVRSKGRRQELKFLSRDYAAGATRLGFAPDELRRALERALAGEGSVWKKKGGD